MLKKKFFPPFQKLLDIYTVFPYFDDAVIFLSGVPVLPLPSVRGRESLFFFIRFSFQLSPSDELGADRSCEDSLWQTGDGIKTQASWC